MINKIFINTICLLVVSLLFSSIASAQSQRELPCIQAYQKVKSEGANPTALSLSICVSRCGEVSEPLRTNSGLDVMLAACSSASSAPEVSTSSAISACSNAVKELAACKGGCKPDYDACNSTCKELGTAIERTEAFRKCTANYSGKPATVERAAVDPTDKKPKEEAVPEDPTDEKKEETAETPTDPSDQNTGSPNAPAQLAALEGLGNTDYGDTSIGQNDASAIDFSRGPKPDQDSWSNAISNTASTAGAAEFTGLGHNNPLPSDGELMGDGKVNPSNASAGANGGAPPAGLPMNTGGQGGSANSAAPGRRTGGGNYRNSAADYLSRHSPFAYQSGPQSSLPGNNTNKRNVANKKSFGPKYKNKENDGKAALHRLFGNGITPAASGNNPYSGAGRACSDAVVFCNMENFYYKIERLPNHEINPDSY